ncbi:MAG TPA: class I SAM-dependent methyltransferase [Candidatus Nanoarchaeia archaeon]|nr:class I SAM-dependent methyltransferase [Candidatus Nanoarchaeia archaeon]
MKAQDFLLSGGSGQEDFWHRNKDIVFARMVHGSNVLDVGCGDGKLLLKLHQQGKKVMGVEFYDDYFKLADARLKDKIIKMNIVHDNIPGEYDCVILSGVIEHIKEDVGLLTKLRKNVRKGGQLLLLTSAYPCLYSVYDKSINHYRRYSKKGIVDVVEKAGFKVQKVHYWNAAGIPFMVFCRLFQRIPVSAAELSNPKLNKLLNVWFENTENHFIFPFGLDLIVEAKK